MGESAIEWTDATWNPVTGCSKVSEGCDHCYAETLSLRRGWSQLPWTPGNAEENVVLHPKRLERPTKWRAPRMVFVNSMSDMFHPRVPAGFIGRVFDVMAQCPQHTFQVLTKRPKRMREWCSRYRPEPLPNVWLGTSIESRRWVARADPLRETPAAVRFISAEPLLGPLIYDNALMEPSTGAYNPCWHDDRLEGDQEYPTSSPELDLRGVDWLIVGGESGQGHRPMQVEWARDLRDTAAEAGTAFFFKQWGGRTPKAGGRELDGRTWDEMPTPALAGQQTLV